MEGDPGPCICSLPLAVCLLPWHLELGLGFLRVPGKHEEDQSPVFLPPMFPEFGYAPWAYPRVTGSCSKCYLLRASASATLKGWRTHDLSLYVVAGSDQSFLYTGAFTGGAGQQVPCFSSEKFACFLSLPSATPHKGDSLILVCSELSQG